MKLSLKFVIFLTIFSLLNFGHFSLAAELIPNDPLYDKQWYLQKLNMPQIWPMETGENNVIVAVIDTGVDISHPDLHDNIWVNQKEIDNDGIDNDGNGYIDDANGWDFIGQTNDPTPQYDINCLTRKTCLEEAIFHGTLVSGVIAAVGNNNLGVTGVSWRTKIMPLRVLDENGQGTTDNVISAIEYAVNNGANIINLSFVGNTYDPALAQAILDAYNAGVLVVSAAGNEEIDGHSIDLDVKKRYPVCFSGPNGENIVLGVGATDKKDVLADFSNYGSSCVDIIAPGQDFFGTIVYDKTIPKFNNYYDGDFSGTSLAAPVISGLAALMKSYKSVLTNKQIMDFFLNNTDSIDWENPGYIGKLGKGFVDPDKIFQAIKTQFNVGQLIKGSTAAVYFYALDGKRYVFPDQNTYFSWYDDFKSVKKISDAELAAIPIGGNVTSRPGVKLLKIKSSPQVYAVSQGGVLRWLSTEELAQTLYGQNWQSFVVDLDDSFFAGYKVGQAITRASDYDPFTEKNMAISIDIDKGFNS